MSRSLPQLPPLQPLYSFTVWTDMAYSFSFYYGIVSMQGLLKSVKQTLIKLTL
jgi:hypothetical protein